MSSDRRPAKVRMVSSGAAQPASESTPARRRTDDPQVRQGLEPQGGAAVGGAAAKTQEGASLLWMVGALVLFLVGCAVGGALFVLSGVGSAGSL